MTAPVEPNAVIAAEKRFLAAQRADDVELACPLTAAEALDRLRAGNESFRRGDPARFEIGDLEPEGCIVQQCPIAVVVACADSRVSPELLFWQGLGRLFVTRVAGNTVDAATLGSIVYAVQNFRTPLVVVLGHECCGAITAAVEFVVDGTAYDPSLVGIVEPLLPAVLEARRKGSVGADLPEAALWENVHRTAAAVRAATAGIHAGRHPAPHVVGARYDLNDGKVEFRDCAPATQA